MWRARIEPVDLQAAEQRGRHGVAGDAEREERDQRAADGGVVRRLGGDDALKLAPPVVFGMLGRPLLLIIGHHAGQRPADARQNADGRADEPGTDEVGQRRTKFRQ